MRKRIKENIESTLLALGTILIVLPITTPSLTNLGMTTLKQAGYFSAVSYSSFAGIRYGVFITMGILLVGLGTGLLLNKRKK